MDTKDARFVALFGSANIDKRKFLQLAGLQLTAAEPSDGAVGDPSHGVVEYQTSISNTKLTMVNTPAFQDVNDWQSTPLETLKKWMWDTSRFRKDYLLSGVVYLLTQPELAATQNSLATWRENFRKLCNGKTANVLLVTLSAEADTSSKWVPNTAQDLPRLHEDEPRIRSTVFEASPEGARKILEIIMENNADDLLGGPPHRRTTSRSEQTSGSPSVFPVPYKRSFARAFLPDSEGAEFRSAGQANDTNTFKQSGPSIYKTLDDDQIRLVRLMSRVSGTNIVIELASYRLDNLPEFEAVSWSWGREKDFSGFVHVRHGVHYVRFPVRSKLRIMLEGLRHKERDRMLWIDELCIDQRNKQELSQQLEKLTSIYESADNVCIWLGPSQDESDYGMDLIPQMLNLSQEDDVATDDLHLRKQAAFSRIMVREWFRRRWCVQEMAFARSATVLCGGKDQDWEDFRAAVSIFSTKFPRMMDNLRPQEAFGLGDVFAPGAKSLTEISDNVFRDGPQGLLKERILTLEDLLTRLPMYEVTRDLDAVYAFLALGRDTCVGGKITIDYERSATDLFTMVVMLSIESARSLDIICRPWAPQPSENEQYPSWVCTMSQYPFVRHEDGQYQQQNAYPLVGLPGTSSYRACGEFQATDEVKLIPLTQTPSLRVRGVFVSQVADVSFPCGQGVIFSNAFEIGGWKDRRQPVPTTFWRTITGNRALNGSIPPAWYKNACEYAFRPVRTPDVDIKELIKSCRSSLVQEFLNRVKACVWGKTFFQTNINGRSCFGFGPRRLQIQDRIAVLFGCSVPVVLREDKGSYSLVGECYLDGHMSGEALPNIQPHRGAGEAILLC